MGTTATSASTRRCWQVTLNSPRPSARTLQPDRSRRYGNLKNGAGDIKAHPWFRLIDWNAIENKVIRAPYIPKVKSESDTSNFDKYPESDGKSAPIPSDDPFSGM